MEQKNLRRVKKILDGKFTEKVNTSIGYEKVTEEHIEGDVWEENKKMWTIINGIKQTVNKLDSVRTLVNMPLTCPKCNNIMRKRLDKKFWNMKKMCFDCVIEEDTQKIKSNQFKQHEKKAILNNMKSYLDHVKEFAVDYIDQSDAKHYVSEQGDIENWSNAHTKEELKEIFNKQIEEFKQTIEDNQNEKK